MFTHSVFKRLVLQTHENQGLFGKGLIEKQNICNKYPLLFTESFVSFESEIQSVKTHFEVFCKNHFSHNDEV